MPRILVIDDDVAVGSVVGEAIRQAGFEVVQCASAAQAAQMLQERWELVISDLMLDDGKTILQLLKKAREGGNDTPFIILTGHAEVDSAVEALRAGAFAYMPKPVEIQRLIGSIRRALMVKPSESSAKPASAKFEDMRVIGRSRGMVEIFKAIGHAAMTESPVMIIGESGVGKELVAREIHKHSPRSAGPFVAFNCSGLTEAEVERELFSALEAANGGTILLKRVNELPISVQLKLSRLIEKRPYDTRHGKEFKALDVRWMATIVGGIETSKRMRTELFFALSVLQITVPPLRERMEDLSMIVEELLRKLSVRVQKKLRVTPDGMKFLRERSWSGNIRELANVLEAAGAISLTGDLTEEELRHTVTSRMTPRRLVKTTSVERDHILTVLGECQGNVARASRVLDMSENNLRKKLAEFGVHEQPSVESKLFCVACGTNYTSQEVEELGGRCPRCVNVEGAVLIPTGSEPSVGNVPKFKSNRFVLYKLLGRGKFSEVWAGWQPSLCRRVVIKFLLQTGEEGMERFIREARIQATLRHPNIPVVYEAGVDELNPNKMFLAIEFIEGTSLDQYNRQLAGRAVERERIRRLLFLTRQIADALDYMHRKGFVHRDVKPQNIIAASEDKAYLIDYGLTKSIETTDTLTVEGLVLGTVPFMSPEQVRGQVEGIDARSDIWGLGATLFYLLSGRFPFYGGTYNEVTEKILSRDPPALKSLCPGITDGIEQLILRSLAKSPDDRWRTAGDMAKAVQQELANI